VRLGSETLLIHGKIETGHDALTSALLNRYLSDKGLGIMDSIQQDQFPESIVTAVIDGGPNTIEFYEICLITLGSHGFDVIEIDTSRYALVSNEGEYPHIVDTMFTTPPNVYGAPEPYNHRIFAIHKAGSEHIVDAFPVYFVLRTNISIQDGEKDHLIMVMGQRKDLEEMARILTI
jgi:hypothetical protein